ncbi:DUF7305 domain-containing protein [Pseudothermotoga sp.]|nr:hypothetical protein [Pseudothermotoga sp.]MDW8139241.1 hypothetical protein [Pseudothermotoga sp.]
MKKGSVLIVTLTIVIFLSLTIIMMLALYSQLINNYSMQQKRLMVSNVAKSGAYVLADHYVKLLRQNPSLANNLNVDLTASLKEFPGRIEYKVRSDGNYITITCIATLNDQNVSDNYSLRLKKMGGLSFGAALVSNTTVEITNNGIINGDVEILQGDLRLENNTAVKGTAYVKGNIVSIGGGGRSKPVIEEDAYAGGSIDTSGVVIKGRAYPNQNPVPFPSQYAYGGFPLPSPPPEASSAVISPDPTSSGIVISRSGNYGNITIENNKRLTFDTSAGELSIYVSNIYTSTRAEIVVKGGRRVKVYFANNIGPQDNVNNQVTVRVEDGSQILFYSASNGSMTFKNGFQVEVQPPNTKGAVFIYAPNATFEVQNNFTLFGAIITKSFIGLKNKLNNLNLTFADPGSDFPIDFLNPVYTYGGWSK